MTKHKLLEAVKAGQKLYAEDHQLWLGDPAQFVDAQFVTELVREGLLIENVLAEDYSEFVLNENPDVCGWIVDDQGVTEIRRNEKGRQEE